MTSPQKPQDTPPVLPTNENGYASSLWLHHLKPDEQTRRQVTLILRLADPDGDYRHGCIHGSRTEGQIRVQVDSCLHEYRKQARLKSYGRDTEHHEDDDREYNELAKAMEAELFLGMVNRMWGTHKKLCRECNAGEWSTVPEGWQQWSMSPGSHDKMVPLSDATVGGTSQSAFSRSEPSRRTASFSDDQGANATTLAGSVLSAFTK
jgi:hypothetical protein